MNGDSSIDIYTQPCVKCIDSGKLLKSTGNSAQCGWKGGSRGRGYMYTYINS